MRRWTVLVLAVLLFVMVMASERSLKVNIFVQPDGSAKVEMTEFVEGALAEIYALHQDQIMESRDSYKQFYKELSRIFYLIYGTTPDLEGFKVESFSARSGIFQRRITMHVVGGMLGFDSKHKLITFSRKNFSSTKDFYTYLESELDDRFFQSAFVESSKERNLKTTIETRIYLPVTEKTNLEVYFPFVKKGESIKEEKTFKWNVNFGGGSYYNVYLTLRSPMKIFKEALKSKGKLPPLIEMVEENVVTKNDPKNIASEKYSQKVMENLRDAGSFVLRMDNPEIDPKKLRKPVKYDPNRDFSKGWSKTWSETASVTFKYGDHLSVKPSVTTYVTLSVHLKWEHKLTSCGWFCVKYKFKKFEGKISVTPGVSMKVNLHAEGEKSKTWQKTLFTKRKPVTFWYGSVPVVIVFGINVIAKAEVGVNGSIDVNVGTNYNVSSSVTFKYENKHWGKSFSKSYNYSGVQFSANAKTTAWAKGSLPTNFYGYVYYVAGPMLTLTPWIKGETDASVGSSNQVGYKVTGGLDLTGKVLMAGWLRNLCGHAPSVSYSLWSKSWTLKSGTYTF